MVRNSEFSHYTVFYWPISGPYGPIMANNRRKRQSVQAGEFTMDFPITTTTGTLMNLNGSVIYGIQVAAVATLNGEQITGERSVAIEMTTSVGREQMLTCTYDIINMSS